MTGIDGKERSLTDDKYISRLLQFVSEKISGKTSNELVLSQITDLGKKIDSLNSLASKGVHSNVYDFEVNQCIIQTYLTIGDILRISDDTSAVLE